MAEFITDIIDIPELIGYVRENAVTEGPNLAGLIPQQEVEDIEYELLQMDAPSNPVARYRSWDVAPPLGKRPGFTTVVGEIPPLGLSYTLNEKELKRFTRLRASMDPNAGFDFFRSDALLAAQGVVNRWEIARGDLLHDGVVTINENGQNVSADFNVPGTHLVTAATLWSDTANSTPVTNLIAWEATYRADNGGRNPDAWLISSEVAGQLALNTQIKVLAGGTSGVTPGIISFGIVGQVMQAAGVRAPLVIFDGMVPDTNGVATRTIPVRDVVAIRQGTMSVLTSSSPSADQLVARQLLQPSEAPGVVVFVTEEVVPARTTTTSDGIGIPVLKDRFSLFRAIV